MYLGRKSVEKRKIKQRFSTDDTCVLIFIRHFKHSISVEILELLYASEVHQPQFGNN